MKTHSIASWLIVAAGVAGCAEPYGHGGFTAYWETDGGRGGSGTVTRTRPSFGGQVSSSAGGSTNARCNGATNIVADAAASPEGDWIGGDPATSSDNPCGVQGSIYAFSDSGLDGQPGTADDTLLSPAAIPGSSERQSPCSGGKCCISGRTTLWPAGSDGSMDYTASVWGAGLGIALNQDELKKSPYRGPAKGFAITTSGTLSNQVVRIGYTQFSDDDSVPFKETAQLGRHEVLFSDVICPSWSTTCVDAGEHPFDLQLFVVGGDTAGRFRVCIDSITPIF